MGASLTAYERETIVHLNDAEQIVHVETSQRRVIGQLRRAAKRNPNVRETATGFQGSTEWARFEIPVDYFNLGRAIGSPRREPTTEQTALMRERGRAMAERRQQERKHRLEINVTDANPTSGQKTPTSETIVSELTPVTVLRRMAASGE